MNPESVLTQIAAGLLAGLVSGGLTIAGTWKLYGWRLRELEERLHPIDRDENSVVIRLARLESRRRAH